MAVTMWGQVVIQTTTPAESPVAIGTLWGDISGTATLKICTSISPYTFSAISSGGGTWGSITGTLSSQTDLQTALNAKVAATRLLTSGAGLTGGGDLSADRTVAVGAGAGITVAADDVSANDRTVTVDTTTTGTPASTVETDLIVYNLPANTLSVNGMGIMFETWFSTAANANNKQCRMYWGPVASSVGLLDSGSAGYNNAPIYMKMVIIRTGSAAQVCVGYGYQNTNNAGFAAGIAGCTYYSAQTKDFTVDLQWKITGKNAVATANDIVHRMTRVTRFSV